MKNDSIKKDDGSPEIAQHSQSRKIVALGICVGIGIIGSSLFFFNRSHQTVIHSTEENYAISQNNIPDLPKPQAVPAQSVNTTPPAQSTPQLTQDQIALIKAKQNELQQRLSAPLMLVNNTQQAKTDLSSQSVAPSTDRNMQFMSQVSAQNTEMVEAKPIGSLNSIIAEGSFIHAILETATNSDLPGYVRATVSESEYSEDGTTILIPRGSRLIGQYKSGMLQGQSRIFMVWTRLITPSGISVQLGSPDVDSLGVAGIGADEVDRHFWQRFGTASLLSIIGTGAANAGVSAADQANSIAAYRTAMANSFSASANETLQQDAKIPPTLTTYQGKPVMVFVAKDLSFKNATQQSSAKINIF